MRRPALTLHRDFGALRASLVCPANGSTFSRKPREQTVANPNSRCVRLVGCNVLFGRRIAFVFVPGVQAAFPPPHRQRLFRSIFWTSSIEVRRRAHLSREAIIASIFSFAARMSSFIRSPSCAAAGTFAKVSSPLVLVTSWSNTQE